MHHLILCFFIYLNKCIIYNSTTHVYLLMYNASEWICLDLMRFINVLIIIIIDPVQYSDWAAPIVPVMKADKNVCLWSGYKLIVNQLATLDSYPIPRMEDLHAQL